MTMELRKEIVRFFENDDNSPMCSGKTEEASVRDKNGEKEKMVSFEQLKRIACCVG